MSMIQSFPDGPYPPDLAGKPLPRVCIVTGECVGPFRNGGLGTSMTGLAELLSAHGFPVTILYTGPLTGKLDSWVQQYAKAGITLLMLEHLQPPAISGPMAAHGWTAAYQLYSVLRTKEFEVIHFNDTVGEALYCMTAKRLGLAFQSSLLCLALHSPTQWILELNGTHPNWIGFTCFNQGERDAVRATDLLWCPSRYLLEWIMEHDFHLPEQVFIQQYVVPTARLFEPGLAKLAPLPRLEAKWSTPPKEIVFFGRLEERKGIRIFCNALTIVQEELQRKGIKVVFMGKLATINGQSSLDFINRKAKSWAFEWRLIDDYDQQQALSYLKEGDRVAVMPSPFDNSPCTIYEAIQNNVPFIAARRGGIPELIHEDDEATVLFDYTTRDLGAKLLTVVREGIRTARPRIAIETNRGRWIALHLDWKRYLDAAPKRLENTNCPRLAVLVDHHGAPEALTITLLSLCSALGASLGSVAIILRGEAIVPPGLPVAIDLKLEDNGEPETSAIEAWVHQRSEAGVLCIRSGVRVIEGAMQSITSSFMSTAWDGLLATARVVDGKSQFVMPLIGSAPFLFLEDKFDSGAALLRCASLSRVLKSGALIAEQPYCGLLECVILSRGVVWPLAEPIVVMTTAATVVWRGEQAQRTSRFSKMMYSQDLTFTLAIGKLNYEVLHPPRLLTLGGNTIFWLKYTLLHPVTVLKMGFIKVFGRERAHRLKSYLKWLT